MVRAEREKASSTSSKFVIVDALKFEAFHWTISSSIYLLFLKSAVMATSKHIDIFVGMTNFP